MKNQVVFQTLQKLQTLDLLQSRESGGCQHYQLHRHDQAKEKSTKRKGKEKIQEKSRVTREKFKVGLTLGAKEHKRPKQSCAE